MEPNEFRGVAGRTLEESTPWWPPLPTAPDGAPNVVVVLLDDVGYAQFGCYGSDIATPTFDRLAANGLRYSNFHTTALCSPTRACLLTGRNHHANGMGRIVEFASGYPGYDATMPMSNGMISEILVRNGYATYCVGKWHLAPAADMAMGGSRQRWPLGRGFQRFYGFLGGETDQYHPDLVADNHEIEPPASPADGYHLTEDLADNAIGFIDDLRASAPDRPFFLWFAPGACHAPHQAPTEYIERYRGRFDQGWDRWRDEVLARQLASGLLPEGTVATPRPHWVPEWESLSADERRLYARMMEVYAGFLEHTDAQVGRLVAHLERRGELDDTVIVVMSDNGASAEGGARGSFNELYFFNGVPEDLDENLRRIDDLGGPDAHNHYPWGWAWAGNTPFQRWKRETHEGGVADPLLVSWPAGIGRTGETRSQYVHAVDLTPTLLDLIGIEPPTEIAGVAQRPFDGVSFTHTFDDAHAPSNHTTQYYEMFGSRGIYHDGWKAVVFHPLPLAAYDGSDPFRPFDEDEWELYHVAEDVSESRNLAAEHPERLDELIARWWEEAERNQVLPLTNLPGRHADRRHRRDRYEFAPGIGSLHENIAPNLRNRRWRITAPIDNSEGDAAGVVVAHGSRACGYALYVADHRLHFAYNFVGTTLTTVSAAVDLPRATTEVVCSFEPDGRHRGTVHLAYDTAEVGSGHLAATVPVTFGVAGFSVGQQRGHSVTPEYESPFRFTRGRLGTVVVETAGEPWRDPPAERDAQLAIQ
jgi:arylsulfatase